MVDGADEYYGPGGFFGARGYPKLAAAALARSSVHVGGSINTEQVCCSRQPFTRGVDQ